MTMRPFVLEAGSLAAFLEAVAKASKLFAPVADPAGGAVFAEVPAPERHRLHRSHEIAYVLAELDRILAAAGREAERLR